MNSQIKIHIAFGIIYKNAIQILYELHIEKYISIWYTLPTKHNKEDLEIKMKRRQKWETN